MVPIIGLTKQEESPEQELDQLVLVGVFRHSESTESPLHRRDGREQADDVEPSRRPEDPGEEEPVEHLRQQVPVDVVADPVLEERLREVDELSAVVVHDVAAHHEVVSLVDDAPCLAKLHE